MGLEAETIERFGAGYCTKGLLKGRLAIPIHNGAGELVAYAGLAVDDDASPRYLFPPKFNPALEVFNLERLSALAETEGPLYLAPEIEGVLKLVDAGANAALGLFDGTLSLEQEEAIADLLPAKGDGRHQYTSSYLWWEVLRDFEADIVCYSNGKPGPFRHPPSGRSPSGSWRA